MRYFHLDIPEQLPELLRIEYMGYDCGMRIRALMRSLDVPYEVIESISCDRGPTVYCHADNWYEWRRFHGSQMDESVPCG